MNIPRLWYSFAVALILYMITVESVGAQLQCWQENAVLGICTCKQGVWIKASGEWCGIADQFPTGRTEPTTAPQPLAPVVVVQPSQPTTPLEFDAFLSGAVALGTIVLILFVIALVLANAGR